MADGDAANAIGLAIMTGIEKVKDLWKQVNKTRDMLANHITGGTHAATAITTGTLDSARLPTIPVAKIPTFPASKIDSTADLLMPTKAIQGGQLISLSSVDLVGTVNAAGAPSTGLSGWTSAVLRNSDGRLGVATSSRRFKQDITPADPRRSLLAAQIVHFRYITDVEEHGKHAEVQKGLIAEQLHELGLTEYVVYDAAGDPFTIRYEMLTVELLSIVQDHDERLTRLEQGSN